MNSSEAKVRVPKRFREATMGTIDEKQFPFVLSYAENMADEVRRGRGLLLAGNAGIGKTWAMAALTRLFANGHTDFRKGDHEFVTAPILFDSLSEFSETWDNYRECPMWETLAKIPWLVINDLGKEYRGGKIQEQVAYKLGKLLRHRNEEVLVTHVTTNLTGKVLLEAYGNSIVSLLSEVTRFCVVTGPDRRRTR